jgi:hypothetical protein
MPPDLQTLDAKISALASHVQDFWVHPHFWIDFVLAGIGIGFSIAAFVEARRAKSAATDAGRVVKIQTVVIELTELSQRLDKLEPEIRFSDARDLVAEISRRLRRLASPFQDDKELGDTVKALRDALDATQRALNAVRPANLDAESAAPMAVYHGIESNVSAVNNLVADLLGLLERRTLFFGEQHGHN